MFVMLKFVLLGGLLLELIHALATFMLQRIQLFVVNNEEDLQQAYQNVENGSNLTVTTAVKSLRSYDSNNDGVISSEELRRAILELDLKLTDKQIQNIVISSDINNDGGLDYDEAGQALRRILDIQHNQLKNRDNATSVAFALITSTMAVCFFAAQFLGLKTASKEAGVIYGGQDIETYGDGIYFGF
jgi:hypothetical protein